VEKVILQRMPKSLIADKLKMFALFTRILNRSHKVNDSELNKDVREATDFWTQVMLEEHERDQNFINNMHDMQDVCQTFLDELLSILDGFGKKCQEQDDMIKQLREELTSNQVNLLIITRHWYRRSCCRFMHIAFLVQGILTVIMSCVSRNCREY